MNGKKIDGVLLHIIKKIAKDTGMKNQRSNLGKARALTPPPIIDVAKRMRKFLFLSEISFTIVSAMGSEPFHSVSESFLKRSCFITKLPFRFFRGIKPIFTHNSR